MVSLDSNVEHLLRKEHPELKHSNDNTQWKPITSDASSCSYVTHNF